MRADHRDPDLAAGGREGERRERRLRRAGRAERQACAGVAVDVEIWTMPAEQFGRFVASIPAPLSIGTLTITDGRDVKGFLVEAEATRDARDISAFGGWRNFMEQMKVSA